MTALKEDSLFWQREVYERLPKVPERNQGLKGIGSFMKGKGMSKPTWSPSQPQWTKGKSSQKGKGSKGQSKGKDPSWPKNWATVAPRGLQFRRDHLLRNKCAGNCGRSHGCPIIKDGWTDGHAMAITIQTDAPTNERGVHSCRWRGAPPPERGRTIQHSKHTRRGGSQTPLDRQSGRLSPRIQYQIQPRGRKHIIHRHPYNPCR